MQHLDLFNMALYSKIELEKLPIGRDFNNIPLRCLARRIEQIPEKWLDSISDKSFDILYEAITGEKPTEPNESIIPLRVINIKNIEEEYFGIWERLAVQTRLALQELYAPENLSCERIKNLKDFCSKLCDICKPYVMFSERHYARAA